MKALRYAPGTGVHYAPGAGPYGIQIQREPIRRSWVVVSSINDDLIAQSKTWGADVIVLDLEDSVHDSKKEMARAGIKDKIRDLAEESGAEIFVRPDIELMYADLEASICKGLTGVVLPKVSSVAQVREADAIVDEMEQRTGLPGVVELHVSLETAKGIYNGVEILAASSRVRATSLGRADLVMDLRGEPNGQLHMMPHLLHRLVILARVAGVEPVGAWWDAESRGTVASPEATLRAARRARYHGYRGALCGKGSQVAALNAGFTPTGAEVAHARDLVAAYEEARARGDAWGALNGYAVNHNHAEAAGQVVRFAELCAQRDQKKAQLTPRVI